MLTFAVRLDFLVQTSLFWRRTSRWSLLLFLSSEIFVHWLKRIINDSLSLKNDDRCGSSKWEQDQRTNWKQKEKKFFNNLQSNLLRKRSTMFFSSLLERFTRLLGFLFDDFDTAQKRSTAREWNWERKRKTTPTRERWTELHGKKRKTQANDDRQTTNRTQSRRWRKRIKTSLVDYSVGTREDHFRLVFSITELSRPKTILVRSDLMSRNETNRMSFLLSDRVESIDQVGETKNRRIVNVSFNERPENVRSRPSP